MRGGDKQPEKRVHLGECDSVRPLLPLLEGDKAPGCAGPGSSRSWSRCARNRIP